MKTETLLLWAGGAFLAYELFMKPKTAQTGLLTQAPPVYTTLPQNSGNSNTGALVAAGAGSLATIIKSILSPSASATANNTAASNQANQGFITDTVSDVFGNSSPAPVQSDTSSLFSPSSGTMIPPQYSSGVSNASISNMFDNNSLSGIGIEDDD
jgi:hypothetical protein